MSKSRGIRAEFKRVVDGKKRCTCCAIWKPLVDFSGKATTSDGLDLYCRACISIKNKEQNARRDRLDPERVRLREEKKSRTALLADGKKYCPRCEQIKPLKEFYSVRALASGYSCYCILCARASKPEQTPERLQRKRAQTKKYRAQDFISVFYSNTGATARAKGVPFTVTKEYLRGLYTQQGGRCAVSGVAFTLAISKDFTRSPWRPSIDKIVPKLGYVPGNVRFVLCAVNIGMNEWGEGIYREIAKSAIEKERGGPLVPDPYADPALVSACIGGC